MIRVKKQNLTSPLSATGSNLQCSNHKNRASSLLWHMPQGQEQVISIYVSLSLTAMNTRNSSITRIADYPEKIFINQNKLEIKKYCNGRKKTQESKLTVWSLPRSPPCVCEETMLVL